MLDNAELEAIESWRFKVHMPSRAAAVRELLRMGLASEGFKLTYIRDIIVHVGEPGMPGD